MKYDTIALNDLKKYDYNEEGVDWYVEYFDPEFNDDYEGDYTYALVRFEDDVIVEVLASDGGEPEDATFGRDWAWVPTELNKAYEAGREAGRQEILNERLTGAL